MQSNFMMNIQLWNLPVFCRFVLTYHVRFCLLFKTVGSSIRQRNLISVKKNGLLRSTPTPTPTLNLPIQ